MSRSEPRTPKTRDGKLRPSLVDALRAPSPEDPWRVLVSGCLAGFACGVEGTDYGLSAARPEWPVRWVPFCPEDFAFGTPRPCPDLLGGDHL